MEYLGKIDLGRSLLTFSIAIGWLLIAAVIYRSLEIGIKVFIAKRKEKNQSSAALKKESKGF